MKLYELCFATNRVFNVEITIFKLHHHWQHFTHKNTVFVREMLPCLVLSNLCARLKDIRLESFLDKSNFQKELRNIQLTQL